MKLEMLKFFIEFFTHFKIKLNVYTGIMINFLVMLLKDKFLYDGITKLLYKLFQSWTMVLRIKAKIFEKVILIIKYLFSEFQQSYN